MEFVFSSPLLNLISPTTSATTFPFPFTFFRSRFFFFLLSSSLALLASPCFSALPSNLRLTVVLCSLLSLDRFRSFLDEIVSEVMAAAEAETTRRLGMVMLTFIVVNCCIVRVVLFTASLKIQCKNCSRTSYTFENVDVDEHNTE